MITRVVMPKLTDTMEEGVVVTWKKQEGVTVVAGDVLAEIETDKAVMDLEAFGSGILRRVLVGEGETVKAGSLIAVIGELDEDIQSALTDSIQAESISTGHANSTQELPTPSASHVTDAEKKSTPTSIKASPRAKALAEEHGIDLSQIKGSGPGGRVIERDILEFSKTGRNTKVEYTERPLSQMRKAIARVTSESKGPVPHFYLTTDIGMSEAERLRKQVTKTKNTPLSLTALLLRATTIALSNHPEINVSYAGESLLQHARVDIGVAVALEDGLIAPVVRDCAGKNIIELSEEVRHLIDRAQNKQLNPEEYTGATFSISNLGMYEVDNFIAVLMPPQAASLAIGTVRSVPVAEGDTVKVDRRMKVTLSCDHRALDGAQGARFLRTFKQVLEHPLELFLPISST